MERPTTILSIDDHKFEAKTYATAQEANEIQKAYFKGAKVEVVGQEPKISEFDPSVDFNVKLELIAQIVVSMDGDANNVVARCKDLPAETFDELTSKLDELIAKKKK